MSERPRDYARSPRKPSPVDERAPGLIIDRPELPAYDVGKNGGYKVADRPFILAIARFEAKHPGLIERMLQVEAHLERNGNLDYVNRARVLEFVSSFLHQLRQFGRLTDRQIEVADSICQQVEVGYAQAVERKKASHQAGVDRYQGYRRRQSFVASCPRCGREGLSARYAWPRIGEEPFTVADYSADPKVRISRHHTPDGQWCFEGWNMVFEAGEVKVDA